MLYRTRQTAKHSVNSLAIFSSSCHCHRCHCNSLQLQILVNLTCILSNFAVAELHFCSVRVWYMLLEIGPLLSPWESRCRFLCICSEHLIRQLRVAWEETLKRLSLTLTMESNASCKFLVGLFFMHNVDRMTPIHTPRCESCNDEWNWMDTPCEKLLCKSPVTV